MQRLRVQGLRHAYRIFMHSAAQPSQFINLVTDSVATQRQRRGYAENDASGLSPLDSVAARMNDSRRRTSPAPLSAVDTTQREQRQPDAGMRGDGSLSEAQEDAFSGSVPAAASASLAAAPKAGADATHWLERRFPTAKIWLQEKNRQWWIRGIQARCR